MSSIRTSAAMLSLALIIAACGTQTEAPLMADPPAPTFGSGMVGSGNLIGDSSTFGAGEFTVSSDTTAARSGMVGSGN